jgi:metal-responsive CopG/Arc/MetJ family transcriptional regulator
MLDGMSTVEKVTVSLPADLLARIEHRRHDRETSRSEVVSELLWRGWRQVEAEEREARYRAAYQAEPETEEERAWAEEAVGNLFSEEDTGWEKAGNDASAAS